MQAAGMLTGYPSPEMKAMGILSRDARVLQHFVQRALGGDLGITQLVKLAFLSDLFARQYLGTPLTDFDYIWHNHGPFDSKIYDVVDELEEAGLAQERTGFVWYNRWKREIRPQKHIKDLGFTAAEQAILDFVAERYEGLPLAELLEEVYATDPMVAVQAQGKRRVHLPMDDLNNRLREQFNLPALLAEEREVKRGNYVLADDFFDALRAEAVAWDAGVD
jgi:hypothetical protein